MRGRECETAKIFAFFAKIVSQQYRVGRQVHTSCMIHEHDHETDLGRDRMRSTSKKGKSKKQSRKPKRMKREEVGKMFDFADLFGSSDEEIYQLMPLGTIV